MKSQKSYITQSLPVNRTKSFNIYKYWQSPSNVPGTVRSYAHNKPERTEMALVLVKLYTLI